MRVFVYEFVTGGGWYSHDDELPPDSLLREGRAMATALAADFAAIDGCTVDVLCDVRLQPPRLPGVSGHPIASADEELRAIDRLARAADWTVVIAPEFNGHLFARVQRVERVGGTLLGPSSRDVALAADKQATAAHLERQGIAVPRGVALAPGERLPVDFPYPAVLKPRNGAGSLGVEWIGAWNPAHRGVAMPARLEAYCAGAAASVACLCGEQRVVPLVACRQLLASETDFSYQGGGLPLEAPLADRARRLAASAVASLPRPRGYLGVDLVLGDDPDGRGDFVIEINPRLTTSYVGLRAFSRANLAATMIAVARGRDAELCWNCGALEFTAAGTIRLASVHSKV